MDSKISRRAAGHVLPRRGHVRVWFLRLISSVLIWTALIQLTSVAELWRPHLLSNGWPPCLDRGAGVIAGGAGDYPNATRFSVRSELAATAPSPPALLPKNPQS